MDKESQTPPGDGSLFSGARERLDALKRGREMLKQTEKAILDDEIIPSLDNSCDSFLKNEVPQIYKTLTDEIVEFIGLHQLIKEGFEIVMFEKVDLVLPRTPDYLEHQVAPKRVAWVSETKRVAQVPKKNNNSYTKYPYLDSRMISIQSFKDFFYPLWVKGELQKYIRWELSSKSYPLIVPANIEKPLVTDSLPMPINFELKFNNFSNEGGEEYNKDTHGSDKHYLKVGRHWTVNFDQQSMQNFIDKIYFDLDKDEKAWKHLT